MRKSMPGHEMSPPSSLLTLTTRERGDVGWTVIADGPQGTLPPLSTVAQVVSNLVSNAIQHGDGPPITLTAAQHGDVVTLEVPNGGAPIPADVLPWMFEPLRRGHSGGPHSIGFGLFIARAVVVAHGGEIQSVERRPSTCCSTSSGETRF
jgi:signal transduction histidine kinase